MAAARGEFHARSGAVATLGDSGAITRRPTVGRVALAVGAPLLRAAVFLAFVELDLILLRVWPRETIVPRDAPGRAPRPVTGRRSQTPNCRR